jgi:hypothetical protein
VDSKYECFYLTWKCIIREKQGFQELAGYETVKYEKLIDDEEKITERLKIRGQGANELDILCERKKTDDQKAYAKCL